MAFTAIVTTVAGRVTEIAPSVSGSQTQPVAETFAGYLKPPVLISTVPSVLARHQAEVQATAVTPLGTPAPDTPAPTDAAAPEPQPAFFTYTVQPGDTVSSIAESFGIAYDYIIWNNQGVAANPDMLVVGATVLVPSTNGIVYNVVMGDTLNDLAAYYQIDVGSILAFAPNNLTSPDSLIEGMTLVLPGGIPPAPIPAAVAAIEEPAPDPAPVRAPAPPPPAAPPPVSSGYVWPFYGNISTYFSGGHPGIDIDGFGAYGAPIAAAASGTVVLTAWDSWGYGYHVIVDHGDGTRTQYAHLSDIWVSQGQYVSQGQAVGAMGNTGYSTGTHLMFNLYVGGAAVNPLAYLP